MAETSSSSSLYYSSSSSSIDSSSSSSLSSSSLSSKSSSSQSSVSTSSSSSFDSSSSSSSSLFDLHAEKMMPFIWNGVKTNETKCFAYYADICYAGMSGKGQILKSTNRYHWEKFFETGDFSVNSLYVKDEYLFVGTSPNGKIFKIKLSDNTHENIYEFYTPVVGFFELNSTLYCATMRGVYQYDMADDSFSIIYKPYGNITNTYCHKYKTFFATDKENILQFDGEDFNILKIKKDTNDNITSLRRLSKEPFSKINYDFINRELVVGTDIKTEDALTIIPSHKEIGVRSLCSFKENLIAGGYNYGRIFNISLDGNSSSKVVFDTDEQCVYSVFTVDTKTVLASVGNTLYLGYLGQLSNKQDVEGAKQTSESIIVQNPSEQKNINVTYPNGGESFSVGDSVNITWKSNRGINDAIKIELYKNNQTYFSITPNTGNNGTYTWLIPDTVEAGDYKVYIEWLSTATAEKENNDLSDNIFKIKQQSNVSSQNLSNEYPDQQDRWYFVKLIDFIDEHIGVISYDFYCGQFLLGTSKGRILSTDKVKLNAYATGSRNIFASVENEYGLSSGLSQSNVFYALYNRIVEISSDKSIDKWRFSKQATINPNETITGIFISPVLNVKNDFGMWKTLIWEETCNTDSSIKIFLKAAKNINDLYLTDWQCSFKSKEDEIGTITRELNNIKLEGNYLQIKVEMNSVSLGNMLSKIMIEYSCKNASYFFTTNFAMDTDNIPTKGFITANISQPVNTEIMFGVTDKKTTEWNDYQVIERDAFFDIENYSNLKIGIKFVSYDENLPQVSEFSFIRNKGAT